MRICRRIGEPFYIEYPLRLKIQSLARGCSGWSPRRVPQDVVNKIHPVEQVLEIVQHKKQMLRPRKHRSCAVESAWGANEMLKAPPIAWTIWLASPIDARATKVAPYVKVAD